MDQTEVPWLSARLHIVTGKGGTGKTTLAAALALALASGGRKTLLAEVEGRQGIARAFDTDPLPYAEKRVAIAPDGGEVYALALDTAEALSDYLAMFYNLKRAGRLLRKMGAVDFATTIAPGMRDVLLIGKVKEAATRVEDGNRAYHAVVLDAPPTGRIARFLRATSEVATLAKVGPIKGHSEGVVAVLRSSQTAIHLVTVLEEMPVQETVDTIAELRDSEFTPTSVLVNKTEPPKLQPELLAKVAKGRLPRAKLAEGLRTARLDEGFAEGLATETVEHARWHAIQQHNMSTVEKLGLPHYSLPLLSGPMDPAGLYELADQFRAMGIQ